MKVLTLNVWNYEALWPLRRRLIADLIITHQPDVVALQETRHDFRFEHGRSQGEQLATLTGYYSTWLPSQVYLPVFRVDEGLTVLTRRQPLAVHTRRLTLLPREREDENYRVCLGVTVDGQGERVHVFNTHFSLSPVARLCNAREVARFMREVAGEEPALLLGDLNALPESPEMRFLRGEAEIEGQRSDFTDCWLASHPGWPGYTYPSWAPVRRIDYAYGRGVVVQEARLVGAEAVDGVYPSDHLGILIRAQPMEGVF